MRVTIHARTSCLRNKQTKHEFQHLVPVTPDSTLSFKQREGGRSHRRVLTHTTMVPMRAVRCVHHANVLKTWSQAALIRAGRFEAHVNLRVPLVPSISPDAHVITSTGTPVGS